MNKTGLKIILLASLCGAAFSAELKNDAYTVQTLDQSRVELRHKDAGVWDLEMRFCVLFTDKNPRPASRPGEVPNVKYNVVTWENKSLESGAGLDSSQSDYLAVGDGFDPSILEGSRDSRTANLFYAAPQVSVSAERMVHRGSSIIYVFPEHPLFTLRARLKITEGDAPPALEYSFTPKKDGYYSVGYAGSPEYQLEELDEIWQPLLWQEKRFPNKPFMTMAYRCTIPSALITKNGSTFGMVVDPEEYPFEELPVFDNSRFGVAVRNKEGLAEPMVFAPVLGGINSKMKAGQSFSFSLRPTAVKGRTTEAFEYIARRLYGFDNYRKNSICTLNQTLENMIDYGMSRWSRFLEDQKGCSYATDAPGTVKNVSSLNPLELAIAADNEEIFKRRAYPYIEYMLSRKKFLFTTNEKQKIQRPSYTLEGPCAPISELSSLFGIFEEATPAFKELAVQEFHRSRVRNLDVQQSGKSWENALFLYEAVKDRKYLDFAKSRADEYIKQRVEKPQTAFDDPQAGAFFFWTAFTPKFIQLLELYEVTKEQRYLEAAHEGARRFTQFTWMSPKIPERDILVNEGGKAPLYWYLKSKGHKQMYIPEEKVPAWRLSSIGLTPESTGTCTGHRAIFMANYAPWLIRIGYYTDDSFLREVGRSAIVGRYCSFPGYHINTARTTAYEKPDYPLREHKELSVNSFHYNHIWPMMSMLLDYLVTETMARSDKQIDFPSHFIEGYAYLQNKFYGTQKGRFYDYQDAVLWMPSGLLDVDNVEINYISARGDNALYLAFLNESDKQAEGRVSLNQELVSLDSCKVRLLSAGGKASKEISSGDFDIKIPPRGLTAVAIEGAEIQTRFQHKVMGVTAEDAWDKGFVEFDSPAGRAAVLNLGKAAKTVYVYLKDSKEDFRNVDMIYDDGSGKNRIQDDSFPWEFTVPIDSALSSFSFVIEGSGQDGEKVISKEYLLQK
ncbi:hypothetical protein L21SP3_01853 [Sedimentisphaera cyanobacteriorum]|uniref:Uncharacterized protein n=1 Tax=Sedimentisphaera cyanobacteriorum TaxID=1940790 RepID=A0A1Q2HRS0_9BACT|nr:hypothetical protein [Sedimentisphaera cyanobacteriorum]AQQ10031.1 hypothetical protein L21SP3_01853 [Sedimentisphaera cyanobacteriorum]